MMKKVMIIFLLLPSILYAGTSRLSNTELADKCTKIQMDVATIRDLQTDDQCWYVLYKATQAISNAADKIFQNNITSAKQFLWDASGQLTLAEVKGCETPKLIEEQDKALLAFYNNLSF